MDIRVGDVLVLKKNHPCGACRWEVLRIGADFKLRCTGCGREVMVGPNTKSRSKRSSAPNRQKSTAKAEINARFGLTCGAFGHIIYKLKAPASFILFYVR